MLKSRASRAAATVLLASGMALAAPTAASAGTADYQYTCAVPGQASWAMPAGTPFSQCAGGNVEARLNGNLTEVFPVNAAGAQYEPRAFSWSDVSCIVAVVGGGWSVMTSGGTAAFVVNSALSAAGIALCKA